MWIFKGLNSFQDLDKLKQKPFNYFVHETMAADEVTENKAQTTDHVEKIDDPKGEFRERVRLGIFSEHNMPPWECLKKYPKAVGWSILFSTALVMEGKYFRSEKPDEIY